MTVAELIDILSKHDQGLTVALTYEGVCTTPRADQIQVENIDGRTFLVIDAERGANIDCVDGPGH